MAGAACPMHCSAAHRHTHIAINWKAIRVSLEDSSFPWTGRPPAGRAIPHELKCQVPNCNAQSPEWRGCRGNGAQLSPPKQRTGDDPTPGLSGRNHAFIPLSVSHDSSIMVSSCAFVCFLLPSFLHCFPVLPMALHIPNNSRAVVLVPVVHRKRTSQQSCCTLGGQNTPIPRDNRARGVQLSGLEPWLTPALQGFCNSWVSALPTQRLRPSTHWMHQLKPAIKLFWNPCGSCSSSGKLCSLRSCLAQGSAAYDKGMCLPIWWDRTTSSEAEVGWGS